MVTPVVTLVCHWWDSPVMCGTLRRMETQTVRVGKKGRVVIPAGLREEAGVSEVLEKYVAPEPQPTLEDAAAEAAKA